nr:class I SAM-dependent methyltransferase [Streptomonospora nanhaiensis]
MRDYADRLAEQGALATAGVRDAFARVARHRFMEAFYFRGERYEVPQDALPSEEVLDIVYSDASLLTIMPADPQEPASSSSSPLVMGPMLEALDLRPGMRVLEIGAGTGYNAALIAAVTGAEVLTVEAGAQAAAGAAAAVSRLGLEDQVRVVHGDGYLGHPDTGPGAFDRIIATVGIAGVPPAWFDQLAPEGFVLAPLAHAGVHPVMKVRPDGTVGVCLWADFMPAVGPLRPAEAAGRTPGATLQGDPATVPDVVPLLGDAYNDAWFSLGAGEERVTRAYLAGTDPLGGMCALVADDSRACWLRTDGSLMHTDAATAQDMAALLTAWDKDGRPIAQAWSARLRPAATRDPLLVPAEWSLTR